MEPSLLALHGLVVRPTGTVDQIAAMLGSDAETVRNGLDKCVADGAALGAKGRYLPTPAGRARLAETYPVAYGDVRADGTVIAAADRFEAVNRRLLDLLTRWQTVSRAGTSVPNDHTDARYDAAIVDELGELHDRVDPVLAELIGAVPRFAAYRERLVAAYDRALAGDTDFVTGVRVDSYHTVWHELHEDMLRVLGRDREE